MADEPVIVVMSSWLNATAESVFSFHANAYNMPRLLPFPTRISTPHVPSQEGDIQLIRFGVPPLALRWVARVTSVQPPTRITDVQEQGPFRFWHHSHVIAPLERGVVLVDVVQFRLLPGTLGRLLDRLVVATTLRLAFMARHRRTRQILRLPAAER